MGQSIVVCNEVSMEIGEMVVGCGFWGKLTMMLAEIGTAESPAIF